MHTAEHDNDEGFVQPTPEKLAGLGRGCFVKVREADGCFWVEITEGGSGRFNGIVHHELKSPCCKPRPGMGPAAEIRSEEITALGCDRYCFC